MSYEGRLDKSGQNPAPASQNITLKFNKKGSKMKKIKKTVKKATKKPVKKAIKKPVKTPVKVEREKIAEFKKIIAKSDYKKLMDYIDMLEQRWERENKYEDFDSYVELIKKNIPDGFKFLTMYADFTLAMKWKKNEIAIVKVTPRGLYTHLITPKEKTSLIKKRK